MLAYGSRSGIALRNVFLMKLLKLSPYRMLVCKAGGVIFQIKWENDWNYGVFEIFDRCLCFRRILDGTSQMFSNGLFCRLNWFGEAEGAISKSNMQNNRNRVFIATFGTC